MAKHERWELQSKQAAPLNVKIALTKQRIREWVYEYGEDGVYVSFSGGKDSTVLLHIVRELFPNIPAVFCNEVGRIGARANGSFNQTVRLQRHR